MRTAILRKLRKIRIPLPYGEEGVKGYDFNGMYESLYGRDD